MKNQIAVVFGSSSIKKDSFSYQEGIDCGKLLGSLDINVMTGGYGGIMEAVSCGASSFGLDVIGVTSETFTFRPEGANSYITKEIVAPNIIERIQIMVKKASFFIVMPGNIGTLNELIMILTLFKVGESSKKLYVWKTPFYEGLKSLQKIGILDKSVLGSIIWIDNVSELNYFLKD
ncbi:MAG: hypothetical protein COB02_14275 [Candidatus Cloacimonadota bacterium]|nr:MAG: hypothetical protein COB02_14275 [Candidatus Cloacimonadota bacterium]